MELDSDGVLTISGTGDMEEWDYCEAPWYSYRDSILRVVIEDGVTNIADYSFYNTAVADVSIGNDVTSIGVYAFNSCSDLTEISIPEGVTSIGSSSFRDCSFLTRVEIPGSVTEIGEWAFACTSRMESYSVDSSSVSYCSPDGVLYDYDMTQLIAYPAQKEDTSYSVADSVTQLGVYAFYASKTLNRSVCPMGCSKSVPAHFAPVKTLRKS